LQHQRAIVGGREAFKDGFELHELGRSLVLHDSNNFFGSLAEVVILDILSELACLQLGQGKDVFHIETNEVG